MPLAQCENRGATLSAQRGIEQNPQHWPLTRTKADGHCTSGRRQQATQGAEFMLLVLLSCDTFIKTSVSSFCTLKIIIPVHKASLQTLNKAGQGPEEHLTHGWHLINRSCFVIVFLSCYFPSFPNQNLRTNHLFLIILNHHSLSLPSQHTHMHPSHTIKPFINFRCLQ